MYLVIDELDSGVFEYLLGELLSVFSDGGKGQLIFTSHNLRALEMLNKQSIYFQQRILKIVIFDYRKFRQIIIFETCICGV